MKKQLFTITILSVWAAFSFKTFAEGIPVYMENAIQAPKSSYSKIEACKLKDNRYQGSVIEIKRPNSANAFGNILFKKGNEIYYVVYTDKSEKTDTYIYKYNCYSKKSTEILNNDQLVSLRYISGDFPVELAIKGFDKNTFLFWPVAGIEGNFSAYILYNSATKKSDVIDMGNFSSVKKIKGFDDFINSHISKIQDRARKEKKTDINLVACEYGGPCTFTQWGDILFSKWQVKNTEVIFSNNHQSYGGGINVGITRGLESTISTEFTLGIKKTFTPITTTATYNWLTNTINTGSITTKIGETTQYEE